MNKQTGGIYIIKAITPLHDDTRDCFEDCIVSILHWLGLDYNQMYARYWQCTFDYDQVGPLGTRVDFCNVNIDDSLSYLGVELVRNRKCEWNNATFNCLSQQWPIILFLDSYWMPWDINYQKEHYYSHSLILTGVDPVEKMYECVDPYNGKPKCYISFTDVENGYQGHFDIKIIDPLEMGDIEKYIKGTAINEKGIRNIRQFAECLLDSSEQLINEIDQYKQLWHVPLIIELSRAANSRRKYAMFLQSKASHLKDVAEYVQALRMIGDTWQKIRELIIKSYLKKNINSKIISIYQYMNEIIVKEQSLALKITSQKEQTDKCNKVTMYAALKKDIIFHYLNVGMIADNQGFQSDENNLADFNGVGAAYSIEGFPKSKIIELGDIRYITEVPSDKDNIRCNGQEVIINSESQYSRIGFLGSSDWWDSTGDIFICYADDTIQSCEIGFTDWVSDNPHFKETRAWVGKGISCENGLWEVLPREVKLYSTVNVLFSKRIKSITLPQRLSMHIFAITLCIE